MTDLIIRRARIWDATGAREADIAIRGGVIEAIGDLGGQGAARELDAAGGDVIPGGIDPHVHMREPGASHKETWERGSAAAVSEGFTTVFDMPNTNPPVIDADSLRAKLDLIAGRSYCHYGAFVAVTAKNVPVLPRALENPATPGLKLYLGSTTGQLLLEGRGPLAELDALYGTGAVAKPLAVHGELEATLRPFADRNDLPHHLRRPARAGFDGMELLTAELKHVPLHFCHISTIEEVRAMETYRAAEMDVTAEAGPHHLFLDAEEQGVTLGSLAKMNPPLRFARDREALIDGLAQGVVDMIGTDHAPHTLAEKRSAAPPSGVPGLDTVMRLMLLLVRQGRLSMANLVRMTAQAPARRFGLARKGRIAEGADADVVILHPGWETVPLQPLDASGLHTACGWSPFEGMALPPKPRCVVVSGVITAEDGRIVAAHPGGRPVQVTGNTP